MSTMDCCRVLRSTYPGCAEDGVSEGPTPSRPSASNRESIGVIGLSGYIQLPTQGRHVSHPADERLRKFGLHFVTPF